MIFHNVDVLGGLDFDAVLLVFGLSNLAFSLADMVVGHLDPLPTYIRAGTLDAFYLRPLPLLAQLMTSDFSLRRLAGSASALVALAVGLARNDIDWAPATVGCCSLIAIVCGTAIFAALFVCAASLQFFLVNGAELTNAFTYGGSYASPSRRRIFPTPLKLRLRLPRARGLHRLPADARDPATCPGRRCCPPWLAWCTPLAAAAGSGWSALLLWRWGTRHYQGGGG